MAARILVAFDADVGTRTTLHHPDHPLRAGDPVLAATGDAPPVAAALREHGYEAEPLPLDRQAAARLLQLAEAPPDLVFNLCDTLAGESGLALVVPAMLELLRIPYSGATAAGLAVSKRKHDVKAILAREGLPTPCYQVIHAPAEVDSYRLQLVPPVILKLTAEHSSIGIEAKSVCWTEEEVRTRAGFLWKRFDQPVLVEEFVDGREIYLSIAGDPPRPMHMMEHPFDDHPPGFLRIRSFDAKWFQTPGLSGDRAVLELDPRWSQPVPYRAPAVPWNGELEDIPAICLRAFQLAGCRDWGRVDLRIDRGGVPQIIDVTPNTYLARSSPCAKAAQASGIPYQQLVAEIAAGALRRAGATPVQTQPA